MADQEKKPAIEYLGAGDMQRVVLADGTGHLVNVVMAAQPCGCKIIGNGTIPHPMDIKRCAMHEAAYDLQDSLERLVRCLSWVEDKSQVMVEAEAQAKAAIADASTA